MCVQICIIFICVEVDLDELCVYTHASVLIAIKSELRPCYAVPSDRWLGVRPRPCPNPQGLWVRPKAVGMARSFHPWASWGAAVATAVGDSRFGTKPWSQLSQLTPGHLSHSRSWRHWCDLGEGQLRIASNCTSMTMLWSWSHCFSDVCRTSLCSRTLTKIRCWSAWGQWGQGVQRGQRAVMRVTWSVRCCASSKCHSSDHEAWCLSQSLHRKEFCFDARSKVFDEKLSMLDSSRSQIGIVKLPFSGKFSAAKPTCRGWRPPYQQ